MHNDDLYSGVQVIGNEEQNDEAKKAIEDQKQEIAKILPSVEEIKKFIQEERNKTNDATDIISAFGNEKPEENDLRSELRARHLHLQFLNNLESRITNKLSQLEQSNE